MNIGLSLANQANPLQLLERNYYC